jgi:hypothetical protein
VHSGIDPKGLSDAELLRELGSVHSTRHETLLHGSSDALRRHTSRMQELEDEYVRRHPDRSVSPDRTREGARERAGQDAGSTATTEPSG